MAAKKKTSSPLRAITVEQRASILDELIRSDMKIRARAERLAEEILGSIDVDEVADEVFAALDVDSDLVCGCSSEESGYVDPGEEAWEFLDDMIEPFVDDMKERLKQGRFDEAARLCQGIVLGAYRHQGGYATTDKALGMAEDFPCEAAADVLEAYFEKRRKKGARVEPRPPLPEEFWSRIPEWSRMREQYQEGRG